MYAREEKILILLLALHAALAGALGWYLFHTRSDLVQRPGISSPAEKAFGRTGKVPEIPDASKPGDANIPVTNNVGGDVESQAYSHYLQRLRAAGCPEPRVREIILRDIDDLFARQRLDVAMTFDFEWWHAEPLPEGIDFLREKGHSLERERHQLIHQWLGPTSLEEHAEHFEFWSQNPLTGPVLGTLSPAVHQQVQDICARCEQGITEAAFAHSGEEMGLAIALAGVRERARLALRQVLTPAEMEEFLLRYSGNAQQLREELRGFAPTSNEFRLLFRAVDPIDCELQASYGTPEALSTQQREQYLAWREAAVHKVLSPPRYEAYLASKHRLARAE